MQNGSYRNFYWKHILGEGESKEDDFCTVWQGVEVEIRYIDAEKAFIYRIHSIDWDVYRKAFPKRTDDTCFDDVEDRLYYSRTFRDDTSECHDEAEQCAGEFDLGSWKRPDPPLEMPADFPRWPNRGL